MADTTEVTTIDSAQVVADPAVAADSIDATVETPVEAESVAEVLTAEDPAAAAEEPAAELVTEDTITVTEIETPAETTEAETGAEEATDDAGAADATEAEAAPVADDTTATDPAPAADSAEEPAPADPVATDVADPVATDVVDPSAGVVDDGTLTPAGANSLLTNLSGLAIAFLALSSF